MLSSALDYLRTRTDRVPETALVLGSGLGALAEAAENAVVVETASIPGYPRATVSGHAGRLVFGTLEGKEVLFVQGRVHFYEGHGLAATRFPIQLAHALGARRVLLTNAAGGIHPLFDPGTLMLIDSHLNLTGQSPLAGVDGDEHPRTRDVYSRAWMEHAEAAALRLGIPLKRGVYLWTAGPSYETKAEIRMMARIGADAVGMSTVPEALQAAHLGMDVLGLSTITNKAAGLGHATLDHAEVLEVGQRVRAHLEALVRAVV